MLGHLVMERSAILFATTPKAISPDYQASALLMAIYINGMDNRETLAFTRAMLESGERLQLATPPNNLVDKHSTGGVGDKTSFIVAPIAAACGARVPMIAGRGLGHTGGTIDKAESIPGLNCNLALADFAELLERNQLLLSAQTDEIAPADKRLYALRDVTATVNSIPLITASIMSKKLAEGISGLVMDIKYGSGAFMKTIDECRRLAHSIMGVGKLHGVRTMAFISNMNWPLGNAIGHSLEIIECIEVLKGGGPEDLRELCLELSAGMIQLASDGAQSLQQARERARQALANGAALEKFTQLIAAQGGDIGVISNPTLLPLASERYQLQASRDGYIESFCCDKIGMLALELGGGRKQKTDSIDFAVGLKFAKKPGAAIRAGETVGTLYHHPHQAALAHSLGQYFSREIMALSERPPQLDPLVADVLKTTKTANI